MTELELKVLADEFGVTLTTNIINLALQCYGKGYETGSKQQQQADVFSQALSKISK
jgi:hypothetical protein